MQVFLLFGENATSHFVPTSTVPIISLEPVNEIGLLYNQGSAEPV